jgi:aspartate/methionine/tyrosine aminotransferase
MKHPSMYLDWYVHVPAVKYDFLSSGVGNFKATLNLSEVDFGVNYARGNPEAVKELANWYGVDSGNVFVSSEGASGQNARMIRYLAERRKERTEAVVEYPTYEPLLRQVQEHFASVKRLVRRKEAGYRLDADELRKVVTPKTALLVLTNPHAPSGAVSDVNELRDVMNVAREYGFHVLCDEVYAEFDRDTVPTLFSVDPELTVVTSSFTKAFGLGGLKLGVALAESEAVDGLYRDVLDTVGNSPNVVQLVAAQLFSRGKDSFYAHRQKWALLKSVAEGWLDENRFEYCQSKVGVTYWVTLPVKNSYKWVNENAIPRHSLAVVPGCFFLFRSGYRLLRSNMVRLGLGGISPEKACLTEALEALRKALAQ